MKNFKEFLEFKIVHLVNTRGQIKPKIINET